MPAYRNKLLAGEPPITAVGLRKGYTLLELMLALGLLGALLSVAWSLMGTYQAAEQKGWQLSMRTQTIRAVQHWLQQDLDHLILDADTSVQESQVGIRTGRSEQPNLSIPRSPLFTGTSLGFRCRLAPSLSPLPFLERLLNAANQSPLDQLPTPVDVDAVPTSSPLWSDEPVEVEYQLLPVSSTTALNNTLSGDLRTNGDASFTGQNNYRLRRTVRGAVSMIANDTTSPTASEFSPADRILTAQDLYRQTDEPADTPLLPVVEETSLQGLVHARFRYFDGRSWLDEWPAANPTSLMDAATNALTPSAQGSLPLAVALSFDLPQEFEPALSQSVSQSNQTVGDAATSPLEELTAADIALASEPVAEIDMGETTSLVENDSYQIQVVVRTHASLSSADLFTPAMSPGVNP